MECIRREPINKCLHMLVRRKAGTAARPTGRGAGGRSPRRAGRGEAWARRAGGVRALACLGSASGLAGPGDKRGREGRGEPGRAGAIPVEGRGWRSLPSRESEKRPRVEYKIPPSPQKKSSPSPLGDARSQANVASPHGRQERARLEGSPRVAPRPSRCRLFAFRVLPWSRWPPWPLCLGVWRREKGSGGRRFWSRCVPPPPRSQAEAFRVSLPYYFFFPHKKIPKILIV